MVTETLDYLEQYSISYRLLEHPRACSGQYLAKASHISGLKVAKVVVVKAERNFYICVLPACYKVDLKVLAWQLRTQKVKLASEQDMRTLFPRTELGAEAPIGEIYGLQTLMDMSLCSRDFIVFHAGTHELAVQIKEVDFERVATPLILDFSYPPS